MENDLASYGFSIPWGHTRSFANVLSNNATGVNGNSWLVNQFKAVALVAPSARQAGGASGVKSSLGDIGSICIVDSANNSQWFTPFASGVAHSLFGGHDLLVQNTAASETVWQIISGTLSPGAVYSPGHAGTGGAGGVRETQSISSGITMPSVFNALGAAAASSAGSAFSLPSIPGTTAAGAIPSVFDGAGGLLTSQPNVVAGQSVAFYDFSSAQPAALAGKLKSITDPAGNTVVPAYNSLGFMTSVTQGSGPQTSVVSYGYASAGATGRLAVASANVGILATVSLTVNGQPVRQASYTYYSGEAGGNVGDLKTVTIEQLDPGTGAWNPVKYKHYRYYVPGDSGGFVHGLKYVVRGTAWQRMVDAGLDPETSPETELAGYADYYFEYDDQQRVSMEQLQGGNYQYSFTYASNPDDPGYSDVNTWATQTIETLPDGNENRVYTNAAGQTLLKIFRDNTTGDEWYAYTQYDSNFNVVSTANSAAVASVTEPTIGDTALVVTLNPDSGLIQGQVYYTSTDETIGAVEGYLSQQTAQEGEDGAPITIRSVQYATRSAAGQTIYPLSADIAYPSEDGSDPAGTTYAYTWYSDSSGNPTLQIQQKTTTFPVVSTDENGSGVAGVQMRYFDMNGRVTWFMNTRGAITYRAYDASTGALVQQIDDVNTALMTDVPEGWATQAGWGSHLISDFITDALGRVTQARGPWHDVQLRGKDTEATPIRRVAFTAYLDQAYETRRALGYMTGDDPTADFHTVGAVSITRLNAGGVITDAIQSVRACACGPLTPGEQFPQEKWSRWRHTIYDFWNRQLAIRVYNRIPKRGIGEAGCSFDEISFSFDDMGRVIRSLDPSGTIQRMVFDSRGLVVSNWTGTNDNGATAADPTGAGATGNNMQMTSSQEYDDGESGGDGNLTQMTLPVDDDSANDRITTLDYDYRDRRDIATTTDGTTTWNTVTTYDNLNRLLQNSTSVVGGNLIAQNRTYYDALGRVYLQETDGVDPSTGDVTNTLSGQNWFDLLGNLIKSAPTGSTSFTKTVYDALNRPSVTYTANVPGTAGVPTGDDNDVSSDTVLQQNEAEYDNGGNVILTTLRQRFDDAIGTGPLQDVQTQPEARVSYSGIWPDGIGRPRAAANFGTNGGAALVRPDVAPARSDTVLVTTNHYKDDGDANAVIDPEGLETRWENDDRGRRIRLIQNFVEGCPEKSQISEYAWHPSGQLQQLTMVNADTGNQVTTWTYGTTLEDSAVASNNLLRTKIYPESEDRPVGPDGVYAQLQYTYNRQGQQVTFIDADGTEHDYAYDQLGRLISDAVPTLGLGLDDSILRIERAYEVRGMLQAITSYSAASGGTVVNESAFTYDSFSNLITDQQSHSGAVVPGTTPQVGYSYADGSANTVRRTSTIYPNGQALNIQYGAANSADDHLNRVTALQLASESNTLVDYTYVGLAWQVLVGYAGPAVELTYVQQGSEPVGDAGDPYNGYDRFGRTVDIRWQSTTTAGNAQFERLQYGFDRDSRRTWRQRVLTTGLDNAYNYDGLSQVTNAAVGNLNLNHTAISGIPAQDEAWDYDPTGNWNAYQTQAIGEVTLDQSRVYDKGNRLTQIGGIANPITLDQVGRMLQMSPDATGDWTQSLVLQWDAWSRIVQITQNDSVIAGYTYDGLTRRLTKTTGDVTLHSYYSDAWRPLEERIDSQTTAAAQYHWGVRHRDDLVRRDRATSSGGSLDETRYVLMDYFSPAAITDQNGTVTERYDFTAFGVRTILAPDFTPIASSECAWEFAFHGQFVDGESGFHDYGYRYYSPLLGRWLSKDPITERGGSNLYVYALNSPVGGIDYLGLSFSGRLGNAVIGLVGGLATGAAAGAVVGAGVGAFAAGVGAVPGLAAGAGIGALAGALGGAISGFLTSPDFSPGASLGAGAVTGIVSGGTGGAAEVGGVVAGAIAGGLLSAAATAIQTGGSVGITLFAGALGTLTGGAAGMVDTPTVVAALLSVDGELVPQVTAKYYDFFHNLFCPYPK